MKRIILGVLFVLLAFPVWEAVTVSQGGAPPNIAFDITKSDIDLVLKNAPPSPPLTRRPSHLRYRWYLHSQGPGQTGREWLSVHRYGGFRILHRRAHIWSSRNRSSLEPLSVTDSRLFVPLWRVRRLPFVRGVVFACRDLFLLWVAREHPEGVR